VEPEVTPRCFLRTLALHVAAVLAALLSAVAVAESVFINMQGVTIAEYCAAHPEARLPVALLLLATMLYAYTVYLPLLLEYWAARVAVVVAP